MAITLPPLPYPKDALEPIISARTLDFHYSKHHNAYVNNLNKLIAGTPMLEEQLESIIKRAAEEPVKQGVFNNAAQVWNHTFYWNCMKGGGGGLPSGELAERIQADFGSFEGFAEQFKQAAATQFGSGYAWLVEDSDKLTILKTHDADLPMVHGKKALLNIDVWEHAYYLDYQNRRPDYIGSFFEKLVNWDFVASHL